MNTSQSILFIVLIILALAVIVWIGIRFWKKRKRKIAKMIEERDKVFREFELAERMIQDNPDVSPQWILWQIAKPHFQLRRKEVEYGKQDTKSYSGTDRESYQRESGYEAPDLSELAERRRELQDNSASRDSIDETGSRKASRNIFRRRRD